MRIPPVPTMLALAVLSGCEFGRVQQGRVIDYKKHEGLVSLIPDSGALPALTIRTPLDPSEMGQEPEAGKLLRLDWTNGRAVIFDQTTGGLSWIPFKVLEESSNISPSNPRVARMKFPVVDRMHKTVTVYSPRDRKLAVLAVAEEHLSLPGDTWRFGDEIRYYYKDPRQALRLMNVTRSDVTGGGK